MKLSELTAGLCGIAVETKGDVEIAGMSYDSRRVEKDFLFAALHGENCEGQSFVQDAVERGASAVLGDTNLGSVNIAAIRADDPRQTLAEAAARFYAEPSGELRTIGVTGTNGKTTTAFLLRDILTAGGMAPGLIGTVQYEIGARILPASRTTPESVDLQRMFSEMRRAGCRSAVLEVSSHSLVQKRVWAIDFDVAVFTNLSPEHLDYHGTMDEYYMAKRRLFEWTCGNSETAKAVINGDDEWGMKLLAEGLCPDRTLTFGYGEKTDVRAEDVMLRKDALRFTICSPWGNAQMGLNLMGHFNVLNALAAVASACSLGIDFDTACDRVSGCMSVPGRLEEIRGGKPRVFVDYAHTEDALRHVLSTLRDLEPARLIVVFGCGGNRDAAKRAAMGATAEELADVIILTSDNPRREEPSDIADQVLEGIQDREKCEVILDREEAIARAIGIARRNDVVLIAGKGHETYQEFKSTKIPFDDREVARRIMGS